MKIGIMTFWWSEDNYGQLLQCYALQKYLRDAGHDAYLIRYDPRGDYIKSSIWKKMLTALNPVKLYNFFLYKKKLISDIKEKNSNPRKFEDFRNKHIKQSEKIYYSYKELVADPPEADVYVVGSDQVWNTFSKPVDKVINRIRAYLLDFGKTSIKRIAFAASFGRIHVNSDFIEVFAPSLKIFNFISVREKSGLNICRQCGVDTAEWVPDPTMLIDTSVYRAIYEDEAIEKADKPYCLLYLLGNDHDFPIQTVYDWARKENLEVIYVSGNLQHDKFKKRYATIPEWIYLIEHSDCVITNSYHCSVFSLLFEKRFGVIPLSGGFTDMNDRFDSFFEQLKTEKRYVNNNDFSVFDNEMDWQLIQGQFQKLRENYRLIDCL